MTHSGDMDMITPTAPEAIDFSDLYAANTGKEENRESIPGKYVRLAPGRPFWKAETGEVEVNAFTGDIVALVPKNISDTGAFAVLRGLRAGHLILTDKMEKVSPAINNMTAETITPQTIEARKLVDNTDLGIFTAEIARSYSIPMLEHCLEYEKKEKNRKDFLRVINARLQELQG